MNDLAAIRQSLDEAMRHGSDAYADVLRSLKDAGIDAAFTQTGGMCAAIEVRLERGTLLVTDASEELPWDRRSLVGWGVGYYPTDDASDGPVEYVEDADDSSAERLLFLIRECLASVGRSSR